MVKRAITGFAAITRAVKLTSAEIELYRRDKFRANVTAVFPDQFVFAVLSSPSMTMQEQLEFIRNVAPIDMNANTSCGRIFYKDVA